MAQRLKTDWILFLTIVVMVSFGLVMVYTASSVMAELRYNDGTHFFVRQLGWAILSFFVLMYFKRKDYRSLKSPVWAFASLGVVLFLQVAVFFIDSRTHRWVRIAGVGSLQPSEFAKVGVALESGLLGLAPIVVQEIHAKPEFLRHQNGVCVRRRFSVRWNCGRYSGGGRPAGSVHRPPRISV